MEERQDTGEERRKRKREDEPQNDFERALWKAAMGCKVAEVTEEYAEVDGQLKLLKRKRTQKDIPPDLKAVQLLMEKRGDSVAEMSDEDLQKEKERLLTQLCGHVVAKEKKKRALSEAQKKVLARGRARLHEINAEKAEERGGNSAAEGALGKEQGAQNCAENGVQSGEKNGAE